MFCSVLLGDLAIDAWQTLAGGGCDRLLEKPVPCLEDWTHTRPAVGIDRERLSVKRYMVRLAECEDIR